MNRCRVYVDASYRDGKAGLAVTGALGDHYKCIRVDSSQEAEDCAMNWAFDLARLYNLERPLTFHTDSTSTASRYAHLIHEWIVVWVSRRENHHANCLARQAYRTLKCAT